MRMQTLALGLVVLAWGCSATTSSRNIRTAGLVAKIDVTSQRAGQSVVETDMVVGGANSNTYVVLEGGDRLYATAGGEKREMNATSDGEYEAKFGLDHGDIEVGLQRDVDTPAPHNKGTLPPPFEITSNFGQKPLSRKNDTVTISWAPAQGGADVKLELDGECIHWTTIDVGGDPGKVTFAPGKIEAWKSKKKESCDVTVTVTRTTKGTTDPAFDSDSHFLLHQVRTTTFVSGP